jgi:tetratricopeptide (TPR) repeat protein
MAYVGLADSYDVLPFFSYVQPAEAFPKAKAAALKALEIDHSNAEAHASLGAALFYFDWNFPEAEREFKLAISLNPNYATGRQFYAELLTDFGRDQEAIDQIKRAQSLDPLSLTINSLVGIIYGNAGQEDFAIEQLKKTLELDPTFLRIHYQLAREYLRKGLLPEAIAEMKIYVSNADYGDGRIGDLANLYGKAGQKTEAYKLIDQLKELRKLKYIPPIQLASAYAGLGEKDEAFYWLEESIRYHDVQLVRMKNSLFFNSLNSDPRYTQILEKIHLN